MYRVQAEGGEREMEGWESWKWVILDVYARRLSKLQVDLQFQIGNRTWSGEVSRSLKIIHIYIIYV